MFLVYCEFCRKPYDNVSDCMQRWPQFLDADGYLCFECDMCEHCFDRGPWIEWKQSDTLSTLLLSGFLDDGSQLSAIPHPIVKLIWQDVSRLCDEDEDEEDDFLRWTAEAKSFFVEHYTNLKNEAEDNLNSVLEC